MKKIVSAVALTALAGSLFAADLTVKEEIKYQPTVAQIANTKNRSDKTFATQGAGLTNAATTIQLKQGPVTVFGKYDFKDSGLSMNVGYGIINWGNANLTFGRLESRFTNRVTNDQNDLSLIEQNKAFTYGVETSATSTAAGTAKTVMGTKKLGINTNVRAAGNALTDISKAGVDADCVTDLQGGKVNSVVLDYTIADALPGKLLLKAVAKTNAKSWYSADDDAENTTTNNSGYSFEAAFTHEAFAADAVVNLDADSVGSWGVYVRPTVLDALNAVIGFTYAWDSSRDVTAAKAASYTVTGVDSNNLKGTYTAATAASSDSKDYNAWAIDARARYAINDQLAAGIYANVTAVSTYKVGGEKRLEKNPTALDVVLNVNYKINDLAKVFVEGEYAGLVTSSDDDGYGAKFGDTAAVAQAGVILTPATGATLTAAVRGVFGGIGADSDHEYLKGTTVVIPLSLKVSL